VKEAANAHDFAGYDYSPLEEGKIVDFIDKLNELVRKAESDLKKLQVSQLIGMLRISQPSERRSKKRESYAERVGQSRECQDYSRCEQS